MDRHQYHRIFNLIVTSLLPQWVDYYREATDNAEKAAVQLAKTTPSDWAALLDRQNTEMAAHAYGRIVGFLEERLQFARLQLKQFPGPLRNRKLEAARLYNFLINFHLATQTWSIPSEQAAERLRLSGEELLMELEGDEKIGRHVHHILDTGQGTLVLSAQIYRDFRDNILDYIDKLAKRIKEMKGQ